MVWLGVLVLGGVFFFLFGVDWVLCVVVCVGCFLGGLWVACFFVVGFRVWLSLLLS